VVEADVPKAQRNPKPPPLTDEEKAQMKAADKATRKQLEAQRREAIRRRGVLDRNSYVITRLHHRYDAKGLPEDIVLQPAASVEGGVALPSGPEGEASGSVASAPENRLQIRYSALHPNKKVLQCENPTRYRWGKAPPDYRGLRKTWTARDLAYKKRDKFVLKDVIKSDVPALGIAAAPDPAAAPAAPAPTQAKSDSSCALAAATPQPVHALWAWLGLVAGAFGLRRGSARRLLSRRSPRNV
jgi:hypothetical protein